MEGQATFQYLNLDNQWEHFRLESLVNDGGELRLASLPGNEQELASLPAGNAALSIPAGIGVAPDGTLFIADPTRHRIVRVGTCTGDITLLPCLQGPGSQVGQLNEPRGVLVGPRNSLYVADTGNHRVQVVELGTMQIRGIWGQPDPWAAPVPSEDPGHFSRPWDLAADSHGSIYVSDPGMQDRSTGISYRGRVQKFSASGKVEIGFEQAMQDSRPPREPMYIAIATLDPANLDSERLLVLDGINQPEVLVYTLDGTLDPQATGAWSRVAQMLRSPTGIAYGDALYIPDATSKRLLTFDQGGTFLGFAAGAGAYPMTVAIDHQGHLLLYSGEEGVVRRLEEATAYSQQGTFTAGPFGFPGRKTAWHRLVVEGGSSGTRDHLKLYTLTTESANVPLRPWEPGAAGWQAAPTDANDALVLNKPATYLWIVGVLQGDGTTSPHLQQMRLEYNHIGWSRYLPSVYKNDVGTGVFLDRFLALFESALGQKEHLIDDLPLLFDPQAAPAEGAPNSWLDWLSSWLAFDLDEEWSEPDKREAIARAFAMLGQRGTVNGLRQMIRLYTGVESRISEPALSASLWSLGETSTLGFDTMLAPTDAGGAALGTTAVLDGSHLIETEEYGAPLFEDLAHRFSVELYAAQLGTAGTEAAIHSVLQREKPAHTDYHLCVIEPHMRVGLQARLGIDTIVGGPPAPLVMGESHLLGEDTVLASTWGEQRQASMLGREAVIGHRTRLL